VSDLGPEAMPRPVKRLSALLPITPEVEAAEQSDGNGMCGPRQVDHVGANRPGRARICDDASLQNRGGAQPAAEGSPLGRLVSEFAPQPLAIRSCFSTPPEVEDLPGRASGVIMAEAVGD